MTVPDRDPTPPLPLLDALERRLSEERRLSVSDWNGGLAVNDGRSAVYVTEDCGDVQIETDRDVTTVSARYYGSADQFLSSVVSAIFDALD